MIAKTAKRQLVRWNKAERTALAARTVELYSTGSYAKLLHAARQAQIEVLPEERQRSLNAVAEINALKSYLDKAKKAYERDQLKKEEAQETEHNDTLPAHVLSNRSLGESELRVYLNAHAEPKKESAEEPNVLKSVLSPNVVSQMSDFLAGAILSSLTPVLTLVLEQTVTKVVEQLPGRIEQALPHTFANVLGKAAFTNTPSVAQDELASAPRANKEFDLKPWQGPSGLVKTPVVPKVPKKRIVLLGFRPESAVKLTDYEHLDAVYCTELNEVRRVMNKNALLIQAVKFSAHLSSDIKNGFERIIMVNGGYTVLKRQLSALNITVRDGITAS